MRSQDAHSNTPRGQIEAMEAGRQEKFRSLAGSMDLRETPTLPRQSSDNILKIYRDLKAEYSNIRRTEKEIASMIYSLLRRDSLL